MYIYIHTYIICNMLSVHLQTKWLVVGSSPVAITIKEPLETFGIMNNIHSYLFIVVIIPTYKPNGNVAFSCQQFSLFS